MKESSVLLLVDNISFSQEHSLQLKTLQVFLAEYKKVRLIGASREDRCSDVIVESDQHKLLDFVRLEIHQFDTHQIRVLISKWFAEEKDNTDKVEQIIKIFGKLNLPRTPFFYIHVFVDFGAPKYETTECIFVSRNIFGRFNEE